jgi:hypothetical protein
MTDRYLTNSFPYSLLRRLPSAPHSELQLMDTKYRREASLVQPAMLGLLRALLLLLLGTSVCPSGAHLPGEEGDNSRRICYCSMYWS